MKKMTLILAAGVAAVALGAGAVAQQTAKRGNWGEPQTRSDAEAKAKAYFARVDADKDGMATAAEFEAARDAKRDERRDMAFDRLDADKNGQISRAEFDAGADARMERRGEAKKERRGGGMRGQGNRFVKLDGDKSGGVSEAEMLGSVMKRFDASDANKDGTVTREERRAAMRAMRSGQ
jgi:EF hand